MDLRASECKPSDKARTVCDSGNDVLDWDFPGAPFKFALYSRVDCLPWARLDAASLYLCGSTFRLSNSCAFSSQTITRRATHPTYRWASFVRPLPPVRMLTMMPAVIVTQNPRTGTNKCDRWYSLRSPCGSTGDGCRDTLK